MNCIEVQIYVIAREDTNCKVRSKFLTLWTMAREGNFCKKSITATIIPNGFVMHFHIVQFAPMKFACKVNEKKQKVKKILQLCF